jgi:hypothetical protein
MIRERRTTAWAEYTWVALDWVTLINVQGPVEVKHE